MAKSTNVITLKKPDVVSFPSTTIDDEEVFRFFQNTPKAERDEMLLKALKVVAVASQKYHDKENLFFRLFHPEGSAPLYYLMGARTEKIISEKAAAIKGKALEALIEKQLLRYCYAAGYDQDVIKNTGDVFGNLPSNKTGDIRCFVDGRRDCIIAIESKDDSQYRLGSFSENLGAGNTKLKTTAYEQLLETSANRNSRVSMMVFDRNNCNSSIASQSVLYIPAVGFVVVIDKEKGRFENLFVAYELARKMALQTNATVEQAEQSELLIGAIVEQINFYSDLSKELNTHKTKMRKISAGIANAEELKNLIDQLSMLHDASTK